MSSPSAPVPGKKSPYLWKLREGASALGISLGHSEPSQARGTAAAAGESHLCRAASRAPVCDPTLCESSMVQQLRAPDGHHPVGGAERFQVTKHSQTKQHR